jgi:hypothetical protein
MTVEYAIKLRDSSHFIEEDKKQLGNMLKNRPDIIKHVFTEGFSNTKHSKWA